MTGEVIGDLLRPLIGKSGAVIVVAAAARSGSPPGRTGS